MKNKTKQKQHQSVVKSVLLELQSKLRTAQMFPYFHELHKTSQVKHPSYKLHSDVYSSG